MRIFIAGVMQGNKKEMGIYSQDYRSVISRHVSGLFPNVEIIDPDKTDPDRLGYTNDQAAEMFFRYCQVAGKVDLLISYLPEASMGSAIEMWAAYKAKIPILTISPLIHNWVVRLLSTKIYSDLKDFEEGFSMQTIRDLGLLSG